jgi:hypothetical protein
MIRLLLFMHHISLHSMHCTILLLGHICSFMIERAEPEPGVQAKDFTSFALDQGKPQCSTSNP